MSIEYAAEPEEALRRRRTRSWRARQIAPHGDNFATDALEVYGEWRDTMVPPRPEQGPSLLLDAFYGGKVAVSPVAEHDGSTISVRRYAVEHLTLWVTLVAVAMVWAILTGIAFAQSGYWLNAATGVFGCLGIAGTAVALAVAGRSRRV